MTTLSQDHLTIPLRSAIITVKEFTISILHRRKSMKEWRAVVGHPDYLVSNEGDVISMKRRKPKSLEFDFTRGAGRASVTLCDKGKIYRYMVHRLVAEAFIDNPRGLPMVNHKNGNKVDNSVGNLEWCTCRENTIHAFETGLRPVLEDANNARLTNDVVHKVCSLIQAGYVRGDILRAVPEIRKSAFDSIRSRKSWVRISQAYRW